MGECVHAHAHVCPKALGHSFHLNQNPLCLWWRHKLLKPYVSFWRYDLLEWNPQASNKSSWQVAIASVGIIGPQGPWTRSPPSLSGWEREEERTIVCWLAALLGRPLAEGFTHAATFYRIREDTSREVNPKIAELQGQERDSARRSTRRPLALSWKRKWMKCLILQLYVPIPTFRGSGFPLTVTASCPHRVILPLFSKAV